MGCRDQVNKNEPKTFEEDQEINVIEMTAEEDEALLKLNLENAYVKEKIIIIKSTKKYQMALDFALKAKTKLNYKLDLRDLTKNNELGLTHSKKICDEEFGYFPCYFPRNNRSIDTVEPFISIEHSSAYKEFAEGYYIVVVGNFEVDDPSYKSILKHAKKFYSDAYGKITNVYMGCLH